MMPKILVVQATFEYGPAELVGTYSTFDKAVEGSEAYSAWHGRPSDCFVITPQLVNVNNTPTRASHTPFRLVRGEVPKWWLHNSKYAEQYTKE